MAIERTLEHPELKFLITEIKGGIVGFTPADITPAVPTCY
jgi:hypothetical protein